MERGRGSGEEGKGKGGRHGIRTISKGSPMHSVERELVQLYRREGTGGGGGEGAEDQGERGSGGGRGRRGREGRVLLPLARGQATELAWGRRWGVGKRGDRGGEGRGRRRGGGGEEGGPSLAVQRWWIYNRGVSCNTLNVPTRVGDHA